MATVVRWRRPTPTAGWLVWVAAGAVAAAMLLAPAYLVLRAAQAGGGAWDVVQRDSTMWALSRTAWLAFTTAIGAVAIAVPLAWLTARSDLPFRRVWAILLSLPLAVPSYVAGYVFVSAFGPRGSVQQALEPLGVERLPEIYGFWGAWFALTFFTFPYVLLPCRAALVTMNPAIEEAARSLGKGRIATFRLVTLPHMLPAIAAGGLLVALYAVSDFGAVSLLRYDTLSRVVFLQYLTSFDRSAAAAVALLLVGFAVAVVAAESFLRGRSRYDAVAQERKPSVARLGRWKWPALAFCSLIALASIVMPLSVIGYWLLRGISNGSTFNSVGWATVNSIYASGLAAWTAAIMALPVVYLAVRKGGFAAWILERSAHVGFALPGIAVALALVFLAARYVPGVYQTLGLLVFAYVVRFLPQALGATRTSLIQVNPHTEEAGRGLGSSAAAVFAKITMPQIRPGIWAGASLVFLTTVKELPVTLLLSPTGFESLATEIWSATNEALFAQAALPALILITVSSIPMVLGVIRERCEPDDD